MSSQDRVRCSKCTVTFPWQMVVQVTLNRPEKLNCVDTTMSEELAKVWERLDQDEGLLVGIITGTGRAFCAGGDLEGLVLPRLSFIENPELIDVSTEWSELNTAGRINDMSAPGLGGLTRRCGKKPIIAAVNGLAFGGGLEMLASCDLIVASTSATFALPEVKRGVVPLAGCLPRLSRTLGLQRCTDLALTGRIVSARTMYDWGLVTRLTEEPRTALEVALEIAKTICNNSPDAIVVARRGIRLSWEMGNVEDAVSALENKWYPRLMSGANFSEGIKAFVDKRNPRWVTSKL